MARGTICDRCKDVCDSDTIFEVEMWKVDSDGKRQGSYVFRSDLCKRCYEDVNRLVHNAPARAAQQK